jgi:hypothetical protein
MGGFPETDFWPGWLFLVQLPVGPSYGQHPRLVRSGVLVSISNGVAALVARPGWVSGGPYLGELWRTSWRQKRKDGRHGE